MRLGKSLLGSIFNKKKSKPSPLKTVGAVVATAVIIKALFDKHGGKDFDLFGPDEPEKKLNYEPPKPSGQKVEVARVNIVREDEDYINTMLGKLALCWYIANIDNDITPEERVELDKLADEVRRDDKIPQRYKDGITRDIFAPGINFNSVTKYLNHADPVVLIDLVSEADRIAAINGVSDREKYAVGAFKHFVEQKTGHKFEADKVRHIDLICSSCGAVMTVDQNTSKAVCDYCGTVKVIFPD